ncbi:MAG: hypothetical protein ACI4WW_02545 [Candidatus Coprovivens sp.]
MALNNLKKTKKPNVSITNDTKLSTLDITKTPTELTTNTNQQKTEYQEYEDTMKSNLDKTVNELKANKVAQKSEIATAEQNTQKYIDNYLKAQGIYGSGMGASTVAGVSNVANQLRSSAEQTYNTAVSEANQAYQNAMAQYKSDYQTSIYDKAINKIDNLINTGASYEDIMDSVQSYINDDNVYQSIKTDIEDYLNTAYDSSSYDKAVNKIDSMVNKGSTKEEIEDYLNESNLSEATKDRLNEYLDELGVSSWSDTRDMAVSSILQQANATQDEAQKDQLNMFASQLNKATTQEEYDKIAEEYSKYIESLTYGGLTEQEYIESVSSQEKPQYNNLADFVEEAYNQGMLSFGVSSTFKTTSGKDIALTKKEQDYLQPVYDLYSNNNLKDNVVIDFDYGYGKSYMLYKNGKFYKLGNEIPDEYSSLPVYSESSDLSKITK